MKRRSTAKYIPSDAEIHSMWEMFCKGWGDHEISKRTGYSVNVVIDCLARVHPDGHIMPDVYGGVPPIEQPREDRVIFPFGESPDAVRRERWD